MTAPAHSLTPADVQSLRDSVRWRVHDHWPGDSPPVPAISLRAGVTGRTTDTWVLHAYGHTQATASDPGLLLACLRAEAVEPGFIRRILDPEADCRLMALAPDALAAERARIAAEARRQAQAASEAQAQAERLAAMKRLDRLDLDDFV